MDISQLGTLKTIVLLLIPIVIFYLLFMRGE